MMELKEWDICLKGFVGLVVILVATTCDGLTDPRDVAAINSLYASLGSPPLRGWSVAGGDPCGENWQGVDCVISNITAINLNGQNLVGVLGESLGSFASIYEINLSDNNIGGNIPSNLPTTIMNLSLSNNQLAGVIPDSFQELSILQHLFMAGNDLVGPLPPSMGNLSSLTTLHLQDNHLSGTLDVLQDLQLIDLDIENNLFSGPIPPKLLTIPNFRSAGNPFNTTVIASPPAFPPALSPFEGLSPESSPGTVTFVPPSQVPHSAKKKNFLTTEKVIWAAVAGFSIVIALSLAIFLCKSRCCKGQPAADPFAKKLEVAAVTSKQDSKHDVSSLKSYDHSEKGKQETGFSVDTIPKGKEFHKIDLTGVVADDFSTPPLDPLVLPVKRVAAKQNVASIATKSHSMRNMTSAKTFSIASLQQYTNSFSQENLIGKGMLGSVYRAELPNGKLLAVKKLNAPDSRQWSDEEFVDLVSNVSKLQHDTIVGLVGYCAEHGQRLLVYEYCQNGTLHEALHLDQEIHEKLSWNARIHLALQSARALEYLHEVCQPPIVHGNFKSVNVLLDDTLSVRVADCGLAPLMPSNYITQFQGSGYAAPELELGSYTHRSDVYSFGVVMLELLTGRKAFDRSRSRGEQFLVRWAIPQLHDIEALSRMVDPYLNGTYSSKSLSRFADIISLCVQHEPEFRPPMSEIVENLLNMIQRDR